MLIEHLQIGDMDDHRGVWYFTEAVSDYVASAVWKREIRLNDMFNGPSRIRRVYKKLSAESDSIQELKQWAKKQLREGAEEVSFARTWPIPESQAPKGHRLHGKRENGYLKVDL